MDKNWWKESVVYQVYPRSFYDSNGDGIGDIQGIIQKFDYIKELGVNVIWLSPVYQSPNVDNGYDISDYKAIMPEFGTMEDMDEMIEKCVQYDIKIIMDLVVNHTSDEHEWFQKSKASLNNPFRDYYIWKKGKNGREPNNWGSIFGKSAWEYDERTDEYYLHLFSKKQPDLNWENEEVRKKIHEMMKWWLAKGIDGFRMDVISFISKNQTYSDFPNPQNNQFVIGYDYYKDGPRIHEFLQEMNQNIFEGKEIMTVGETPGVTIDEAIQFTGESRKELDMIFQFEHMGIDCIQEDKWKLKPFNLPAFKQIMTKWQNGLDACGWNSLFLCNHDQPRSVSRFGNDTNYRRESATALATMLHMMKGTPFIYQGEELGMTNVAFSSIDDYRDIETLNMYHEQVVEKGEGKKQILNAIHAKSRDNARTPMQWDNSRNAGFSCGVPWIKVNNNYKEINVLESQKDNDSILQYYRRLIKLRKEYGIIVYGKYDLILLDHNEIFAYTRTLGNERLLVITNISSEKSFFSLPEEMQPLSKELLISNYPQGYEKKITGFLLKPYESLVYKLYYG